MRPIWLGGHSLGAAEAADEAALLTLAGRPPSRVVLAGEPKEGGEQLRSVLHTIPDTAWHSYKNGDPAADILHLNHDIVTDAPPFADYLHRDDALRLITARPSSQHYSDLGAFAWHHVSLYEAACPAEDRDVMEWVAKIYDRTRDGEWDFVGPVGPVFMGYKRLPEADLFINRGSITFQDWVRDLFAVRLPLDHDDLGPIHAGFFDGVPEAVAKIKELSP